MLVVFKFIALVVFYLSFEMSKQIQSSSMKRTREKQNDDVEEREIM